MLSELMALKKHMTDLHDAIKQQRESNVMDYVKLDKGEHSLQLYARRINLGSEFYDMAKHFQGSASGASTFENNPVRHYCDTIGTNNQRAMARCIEGKGAMHNQDISLMMPVLNRIVAKGLTLLHYQLTTGVCAALGSAFVGNPRLLTAITLDSNGLDDRGSAKITRGLQHLAHVTKLVYRSNDFGMESVEGLRPLLL